MATIEKKKDIRRITPACRATTFSAKTLEEDPANGKIAFPLASLTPSLFIAKSETDPEVSIQPALVLGLFRDLLTIGAGFNLTEPDQGEVFLLFGIGAGFQP